jgi:transcriptional regulator with XRE-family HTH domain
MRVGGFAEALRALMDERGISANALARQVPCDKALISRYRSGRQQPSLRMAQTLDDVLGAGGQLAALGRAAAVSGPDPVTDGLDDEIVALELGRRASASDVGTATVERLAFVVDSLAVAYPGTPPAALLLRIRRYLDYVTMLAGVRATLEERRRLLTAGGWLSLLAATCAVDLGLAEAAAAYLGTAAQLARETRHAELAAWCLETRAWQVLTEGDYRSAVTMARGAQDLAPKDGSAYIQAAAQEGRAWARIGDSRETYGALRRVEALVSALPVPDEPEHHYRYDPAKQEAYVATTLAWAGDPAAEGYARQVLGRLESPSDGPSRPRRAASARLDLALTLSATGRLDEAAGIALDAVTSRLLVPSNYWRAEEVISAVAARAEPEARELREAYREICRGLPAAAQPELS